MVRDIKMGDPSHFSESWMPLVCSILLKKCKCVSVLLCRLVATRSFSSLWYRSHVVMRRVQPNARTQQTHPFEIFAGHVGKISLLTALWFISVADWSGSPVIFRMPETLETERQSC